MMQDKNPKYNERKNKSNANNRGGNRPGGMKRGGGELADVLDELAECVAYEDSAERHLEKQMLSQAINDFLRTLSETERKIFVCRYFYMESVEAVCKRFGYSASKVKSTLFRVREKLRIYLQKEGFQ